MLKKGQWNKVVGVRSEFSVSALPIDVEILDQNQLELIATFSAALPSSLSGDLISILKKNLELHGGRVQLNIEAS